MKKSFLLHLDSLEILNELTNEQKGQLFDAIYQYHLGNDCALEPLLKIAFIPFKNQFERDSGKYQKIIERNRINGSKGGRPKKENNPVGLSITQDNPRKPKKPVNDNDNVNVKVKVNVKEKKDIPTYLEFKNYAFSKKSNLDESSLKLKYESWKENNWKDGNNKPIKNWKSKLLNTIPYLKEKINGQRKKQITDINKDAYSDPDRMNW